MPPKTQAYMDSLLNINRAPNYGRVDDDDDTTKALIQEPQYGYSAKDTPIGYPPSYPPTSEYSSDRGPVRPRPKQVVSDCIVGLGGLIIDSYNITHH
ncbi:hypothetical protein FRB95_000999 [Tulasnella sp. JGI-2019a]|nr:hypothetical protein FRB95_000999 [Tulasnella sp. JGI-2019a]